MRRIIGTALMLTLLAGGPAHAQQMIGFPLEDFGKIVLSSRQAASGARLEMDIGAYNNEPISNYGKQSLFARLGRPVGRLDVATDVRGISCTGFMISEKYVLTNHHCVPGLIAHLKSEAPQLGATRILAVRLALGYTRNGVSVGGVLFNVNPDPVESDKDLDYAILEISGRPADKFGYVRIASLDTVPINAPYWIIGHPRGGAQRISREQCKSADPSIDNGRLLHTCDTLPGNSGSPVFDPDTRSVIALHHAGSQQDSINFAIPMARIAAKSEIIRDLIGTPSASGTCSVWPQIRASAGTAEIEAFLTECREGIYAKLATARLQELSETKVAVVTPPRVVPPGGCDDILVKVAAREECLKPGDTFQDCQDCPEMVVVPAGSFMMGSPKNEKGRDDDEGPRHRVTIPAAFAVGKFEVTFAEWDACRRDGGCKHKPSDLGWGRGEHPVIQVSWDVIDQQYLPWLKKKTEQPYRLLTEAEWEYVARAGTTGPFSWDGKISTSKANYYGDYTYDGSAKGENRNKTMPVKNFKPNAFGLYQVHGNVMEWTEDCWNDSYKDAPVKGSAWTVGDCRQRVLRGGTWGSIPRSLRSANRSWSLAGDRFIYFGFRLARTLNP